MEYPSELGFGPTTNRSSVAALLDPHRYLRDADLAMLYGSREDAIALIAQAYLAFDLLTADCGRFNSEDKES
jgi:hypothetical protein